MKLKDILDAITSAETKLVPIFVVNPFDQALAGIAFLAEESLFAWIERLHAANQAPSAK